MRLVTLVESNVYPIFDKLVHQGLRYGVSDGSFEAKKDQPKLNIQTMLMCEATWPFHKNISLARLSDLDDQQKCTRSRESHSLCLFSIYRMIHMLRDLGWVTSIHKIGRSQEFVMKIKIQIIKQRSKHTLCYGL